MAVPQRKVSYFASSTVPDERRPRERRRRAHPMSGHELSHCRDHGQLFLLQHCPRCCAQTDDTPRSISVPRHIPGTPRFAALPRPESSRSLLQYRANTKTVLDPDCSGDRAYDDAVRATVFCLVKWIETVRAASKCCHVATPARRSQRLASTEGARSAWRSTQKSRRRTTRLEFCRAVGANGISHRMLRRRLQSAAPSAPLRGAPKFGPWQKRGPRVSLRGRIFSNSSG